MRNAIVNAIGEMIKQNPNVYLITGDLWWGVFDDLLRDYPKQCLNVWIAEQNMIGIAAWLALEGKKVFCYSIVPFVTMRAYEQIRVDICSHNLDVTLIWVGWGLAYGMLGNTHYGLEDINLMRGLPNMKIFCPIDKNEILAGMDFLKESGWPMYVRLNRWWEPNVIDDNQKIDIHEGTHLYNSGDDILLLSTGRIGTTALEVAERLGEEKYKVQLYTVPIMKPFNTEIILERIQNAKAVFTIEEHTIYGGLGSTVAEIIAEAWLSKKFARIGIKDQFFYVAWDQEYMKKVAWLDVDSIYSLIIRKVNA